MNAYAAALLTAVAFTILGGSTPALAQDANPFEGEYRRYSWGGDTLSIGPDGVISGRECSTSYWLDYQAGPGGGYVFYVDEWLAEYEGQVTADGDIIVITRLTYTAYVNDVANYGTVEEWHDDGVVTLALSGNLSFQGTRSGTFTELTFDASGAVVDSWSTEFDAFGISETWTTINPVPPPAAPTNLAAAAFKVKGSRFVDLSWTQSDSADVAYNRIYRSGGDNSPATIVTVNAGQSFRDTTVPPGEYAYHVAAVRVDGVEGALSTAAVVTVK